MIGGRGVGGRGRHLQAPPPPPATSATPSHLRHLYHYSTRLTSATSVVVLALLHGVILEGFRYICVHFEGFGTFAP